MSASSGKLQSWAERLERGDDPQAVAREMRLALRRGRPPAPADQRVWRRMVRAVVAEQLFAGTFPARLVPEEHRLAARAAESNRTEADAVAGDILGDGASTVEKARRIAGSARRPLNWEESLAYVRLWINGPPRR